MGRGEEQGFVNETGTHVLETDFRKAFVLWEYV